MTPQSSFIVAAPIVCDRKAELRRLLSTMNDLPGMARPGQPAGAVRHVRYAAFRALRHSRRCHARRSQRLRTGRRVPRRSRLSGLPWRVRWLGRTRCSPQLAERAADGLRTIFAYCVGFDPNSDLLQWMRQHSVRPAASYVNWIGRTVRQIKEEARLHLALADHLAAYLSDDASADQCQASSPSRSAPLSFARLPRRDHG